MATIRAYTTIEQSKKLAEILPLESADMHYCLENRDVATGYEIGTVPFIQAIRFKGKCNIVDIQPAWSLASLLDYLNSKDKFPEIKELRDGRFKLATYIWDCKDCIQVSIGDSIVDACYELILKLNELKLL